MCSVENFDNRPTPPPGPPPGLEGFRLEVFSKVYEWVHFGDEGYRRGAPLLYTSPVFQTLREARLVESQIQAFLGCIGSWPFVSKVTDWQIRWEDRVPFRSPPMQREGSRSNTPPPMQEERDNKLPQWEEERSTFCGECMVCRPDRRE